MTYPFKYIFNNHDIYQFIYLKIENKNILIIIFYFVINLVVSILKYIFADKDKQYKIFTK